jgi:hypothetical protein
VLSGDTRGAFRERGRASMRKYVAAAVVLAAAALVFPLVS